MYKEGVVVHQMFPKWFAQFFAGDFLTDDAPWSDRPVEGDSNQTETFMENKQWYTQWEIRNILKIELKIICTSLGMFIALMLGFCISEVKKLFLTLFPHTIHSLNIMETFHF